MGNETKMVVGRVVLNEKMPKDAVLLVPPRRDKEPVEEWQARCVQIKNIGAEPQPSLAAAVETLEKLIARMRRDAEAHEQEAANHRRVGVNDGKHDDVLAQVHRYWADDLEAALQHLQPADPETREGE